MNIIPSFWFINKAARSQDPLCSWPLPAVDFRQVISLGTSFPICKMGRMDSIISDVYRHIQDFNRHHQEGKEENFLPSVRKSLMNFASKRSGDMFDRGNAVGKWPVSFYIFRGLTAVVWCLLSPLHFSDSHACKRLVPFFLIFEHFHVECLKGLEPLQGICLIEMRVSTKPDAKMFLAALFITVPN